MYMNITTLLVLISAFIIAFSICAVIIKRYLRSKQPSIESVIKDLNMPGQSIGYLSGHTVFASSYVIFSNAELVHIKINSASTPTITRIAYRDIKVVALGGVYFLHLKVQSTAGDSFKVSPV